MASFDNAFGLRGRLGNVVFCELNGVPYARRAPEVVNNPNTPKQQAVRSRLRVAVRFFQKLKDTPLKDILDVSAKGICSSGYTLFMKKNLKAFQANGQVGDFSQLHFAAGKRQQGYNLTGSIDERGMVTLNWENGVRVDSAEKKDRLMVVALYSDRAFTPILLENVEALREEREAIFRLVRLKGVKVHCYCFFVSPDGEKFSDSQYIQL